MTRTTYLTPGVYVEEVPSARQPITGVGTNTAAFIGIVPNKIYYPVLNTSYDPVAAKTLTEVAVPGPAPAPEGTPSESLQDKHERLKRELETLKATEGVTPRQIRDKERDVAAAAAAKDAATAAPASAGEDFTDFTGEPDVDWLEPTESRKVPKEHPYYFKVFNVDVDPGDTKLCTNFTEYTNRFGPFSAFRSGDELDIPMYPGHHALTHAVYGFFKNGGTRCFVVRLTSDAELGKALEKLESIDEVALIAAPGLPRNSVTWDAMISYAENEDHENVFAILDSAEALPDKDDPSNFDSLKLTHTDDSSNKDTIPKPSKNASFYFPHIEVVDPAKQIQDIELARRVDTKYRGRTYVPPSGHMAGIYARTDEERGVHKAPANCVVRGAIGVKYYVSKIKQAGLNPQGVNVIRTLNGAVTVWGARTIGGDRNGEWKYINVRRFFLFLQESIDEGTQWIVFEPNDYALWGKIRLNVSAFLTNVWRSGALFGLTPEEAFYVKCDAELNPPEVRDLGQVITEIGVAIVRPSEFVIFRISQSTGLEKS